MANSIATYTDSQIMKCLLTHDFDLIGKRFEDNLITKIKTGAFFEATNLDEVVLPAVTHIGSMAFAGTNLTTLTLTWANIVSIGIGAFQDGFGKVPQNLTLPSLTALGAGAFAGASDAKNTELRTISLPIWTGSSISDESISSNTGIFAYCSALTSVSAPELLAIPMSSFQYCTALTELVFPKATSIGSGSFTGCTNLTKIDIGGAVTSMNSSFLSTTTKLEALILLGVTTVPNIGNSTFNDTRIASGQAYVYVPKSLEDTFKVANRWSNYASQIRAIEDYPAICGS